MYDSGINIMSRDWDNLIILDACRWDTFKRQNNIKGDLKKVVSKGSNSWEFVRKNFSDDTYHDTIYITSNVHYMKLSEDPFYYSETINRIYPEELVTRALELSEEYSDKRVIVHLMLPHAPYHSQRAQELREQISQSEDVMFFLSDVDHGKDKTASEDWDLYSLLNSCKRGYISKGDLYQVYEENLEIALDYANDLVEGLNGKSVITSDHGELLGERLPPFFLKDYGHNEGVYCDELRYVPWLEIEGDTRRKIKSDKPIPTEDISDEAVDDRLKALGYK